MDESVLIQRAKRGDVTAFNELILTYQTAVYNVALRFTGDPASADDATQETFISAYKSLNSFDKGNFKAWLIRIVHNKCRDAWRKTQRHPEPSIDKMGEDNPSNRVFISGAAQPDAVREQSEMVDAVQQCLNRLPDDQRVTVVLRDVEGYDYSEIADMLAVSLGTVKSRLNRGRRRLQGCLRKFKELLPSRYRLEGDG